MVDNGNRRRLRFKITAILSGLAVSFAIGEMLLRILGLGYGNCPLLSDPILHHRHPKNYIFTSHIQTGEFGGFPVYYDKDGLRTWPGFKSAKNKVVENQRLAFMGDSCVEGIQVSYPMLFVGILDRLSKRDVVVKNYGVSSYNPMIYLLQWETDVSKFKPTHVFVMLHWGDMAVDDKKYSKKAVYSFDKKLTAIPGPGNSWWSVWLRELYFARLVRKSWLRLSWVLSNKSKGRHITDDKLIEEDSNINELSAKCLIDLNDKVIKTGAKFTLMAVPSKYKWHYKKGMHEPEFSDTIKAWARTHSIDFLDLVPYFRRESQNNNKLFYDIDCHFNVRGNKVVARAIEENHPQYFSRQR